MHIFVLVIVLITVYQHRFIGGLPISAAGCYRGDILSPFELTMEWILVFPCKLFCWLTLLLELQQIMEVVASTTMVPQCRSGKYIEGGDCCESCPAGEGAISICSGLSNTKCEPCRENVTFSDDWGIEPCRQCTECNTDEATVRRCNLTHDSTCRCKVGLFRKNGGGCSQCNVCPPGYGTIQPCTFLEDIMCERCVPLKTYSDVVTRATMCKPCTKCGRGSYVLENCTVYSDTVCSAPPHRKLTPTPLPGATGRPYHPGVSIVPLYCVLLAAIVIGLLIYVLFKRWSFHQIKLRASQKMVRSNTSSTDIEKNRDNYNGSEVLTATTYTGPSSYVVATVSPSTNVSPSTLYKELHSDRKVELEEKLLITRNSKDWRALCIQLNFTESEKEDFGKSTDGHLNPVRSMLHQWQSREGTMATVKVLSKALIDIQRRDLADLVFPNNDTL